MSGPPCARLIRLCAILVGVLAVVGLQTLVTRLAGWRTGERTARLAGTAPAGTPMRQPAHPTRQPSAWTGDSRMPLAGPAEYGVTYFMLMPGAARPVAGDQSREPARRIVTQGDLLVEYSSCGVTFWQNHPRALAPKRQAD